MARIETVVTNCTDCKYSKQYVEEGGNTSYILVCRYWDESGKQTDEQRQTPTRGNLLLSESTSRIKNYKSVDIPKDCPLEDYTGTKSL